jgi:hypothetical protein
MSKFDYEGMQTFATALIDDAGMVAALRREGNSPLDRECIACIYDYHPRPRENKLALPVERRVLIAATPEILAQPPDFETDKLVVYQQPIVGTPIVLDVLRFLAPAKVYSPAGLIICWELQVQV